jgi:hypothetical protein
MYDPSLSHKRLRFGYLEGTFSPSSRRRLIRQPLDPLVVHDPASRRAQQRCDLPAAIAAILSGQLDDVGGQALFVIMAPRPLTLPRAMLPEHKADPALAIQV